MTIESAQSVLSIVVKERFYSLKMSSRNKRRQNNTVTGNYQIGLIIILIIAVYIIVQFFKLINREEISAYQVREGSLAISSVYTGLAIREEQIFPCSNTGYINYLAREGEHMAVGDLLYIIDEGGALENLINQGELGENSLSDKDLANLRTDIINFNSGFDKSQFYTVYDFLYSIDGSILKIANMNILNELDTNNSAINRDIVKLNYAPQSGYVVYNIDGYESISINGITPEMFDTSQYEKQQLVNNSLVEQGSSAYKMITSEDWMLVIQLEEERALELMTESYVQIKFLSTQKTVWAGIQVQQLGEHFYGYLSLNNSAVTFCNDRFIDIELVTHNEQGLKIPISSIVYQDFIVVPPESRIERLDANTSIFERKAFLEDGQISSERVTVTVYAEKDEGIYVDNTQLRIGDYLLYEGREEPVSRTGQLVGVYCINQGYAEFRQIVILYQNEEYAIIQKNTDGGINVYDYIVLDASVVSPDDFIFE